MGSSTTPFSISQRAQTKCPTWPARPPYISRTSKPYKNLHFLSNPTHPPLPSPSLSSSSSFPLNPKFPLNLLPFHPLHDSTDAHLLEDLENSMVDHPKFETLINFDFPRSPNHQIIRQESPGRVFIQEPPWISALFFKGLYKVTNKEVKVEFKDIEKRKYNVLRRRQIREETESWERMLVEYKGLIRDMCERKLAPNLPYVKGLFLGWFEPLKEAIEMEQNLQRSKKQKAAFAPHIEMLPADKMTVIVMHKMMGLVMVGHDDGCVQVVQAAVQIGLAIEQEVRIHNFLEKTKNFQRKKIVANGEEDLGKEKEILRKRVNNLIRRKRLIEVQKLVKNEEMKPWGRDTVAKLGCRLIELLTETAYVQSPVTQSADVPPDVRPAFRHRFKTIAKHPG